MKESIKILPKIKSPSDVKRVRECCLTSLADEMRRVIVDTVSKNGGHLASNLGMVETTLAIHRVFDLPKDSVVFDVSHQAYAHKLLTGRYEKFHTLRQTGGISGFTNRNESEFDTVTAGHSGSAISTAIGIAEANRLKKNGAWTVAVVGDGSFTNGMIYEALNQLASKRLRLIVILNDNEMSISKNVGGLTEYLACIRTSSWYFDLKYHSRMMLEQLPVIGTELANAARMARDAVKRITNSETWFESFGLDYLGPADGHNIGQMINVLREAKKKNSPVVVHIKTVKGLGYAPSEEHPEKFHSVSSFDPVAEYLVEPKSKASDSRETTFTKVVSRTLVSTAENDSRICAITAAMTEGCGLGDFARLYPERFFDTGIAEEHAVTMAGGLSLGGMVPVTVLYSTFAQRVFDQMWHDVALQNTKAVFLFSHCGLVPGDGITHQGIYDAALFSRISGVKIYSPDTYTSFAKTFSRAMEDDGISIVRYPKGREAQYPEEIVFTEAEFTKTAEIGSGARQFLILTYSRITENCVKAAMKLAEEYPDFTFRVCSFGQIVPLTLTDELLDAIHASYKLLFVEEHIRSGGIGESLVSDSRIRRNVPIHAIEEPSVPCGDLESITKLCRMDPDSIAERIREEIGKALKYRIEIE